MRVLVGASLRLAFTIAVLLLSVACHRGDPKMEISGFGGARVVGFSGIELIIEVNSRYKREVEIDEAQVVIYDSNEKLVELNLIDGLTIEPLTTSSLKPRFKMQGLNPVTMLKLLGGLSSQELSSLSIDYTIRASKGSMRRTFSEREVALSDFIRTFVEPNNPK